MPQRLPAPCSPLAPLLAPLHLHLRLAVPVTCHHIIPQYTLPVAVPSPRRRPRRPAKSSRHLLGPLHRISCRWYGADYTAISRALEHEKVYYPRVVSGKLSQLPEILRVTSDARQYLRLVGGDGEVEVAYSGLSAGALGDEPPVNSICQKLYGKAQFEWA